MFSENVGTGQSRTEFASKLVVFLPLQINQLNDSTGLKIHYTVSPLPVIANCVSL